MSEQKFDKLFSEKLTDYSEIPPPRAAEKLNRKLLERKRGVWMQFSRLAAALALIAVSVYVVRGWQDSAGIEQKVTQVPETAIKPEEVKSQEAVVAIPERRSDTEPELTERTDQNINKPPEQAVAPVASEPALALNEAVEEVLVDNDTKDQIETESEINASPPTRTKVTITYKRSPAPPEPTLALQDKPEQKSKRLKKLWRKAQSFNYSLAGIRSTKDELLAIERKNKTKESKSN